MQTAGLQDKIVNCLRIYFLCIAFAVLITGGAFAQDNFLLLDATDVRLESAVSNGVVTGYNLYVRKKAGMESVMLTEPNGYYALRSMEWNAVNGGERRELSGVTINDAYSRFSILSSTPIPDAHFGCAFRLFVPNEVIYGNPSSPAGTVVMRISHGFRINVRTFDHKYADPNIGRHRNNQFMLIDASPYRNSQYPHINTEIASPPAFPRESTIVPSQDSSAHYYNDLRYILINIIKIDRDIVYGVGDNDALQRHLQDAFNRR